MSDREWKPSIPGGPEDPAEPAAERSRRTDERPRTLRTGDRGESAAVAFDPALKHFSEAYRPLDPQFSEPAARTAWLSARRAAMDVALRAVGASGDADSLVLRGSVLMSQWFGEIAREPHDLDFVVVPADWMIEEDRTGRMLDAITAGAERLAPYGGLVMPASEAVCEYIWTYERVPGRRLVLPWSAPGMRGGQVQLDFVFNEPLPVAPEPVVVAGVPLLGATPELSLAWKLVWLAGDMYPQGKDLYDAVLLAESCTLPYPLLAEVFRLSGEFEVGGGGQQPPAPEVFEGFAQTDWATFHKEYPGIPGSAESYADRLLKALEPTFAGAPEGPA
ncbi:nucleotidyl transferase AbiEii/AbiGii toxin family protein [Streptomyces sp. NBC_00193]|uniref:nucleotidyl transferase AbiEii/AbiGii toxin family protein n=1 Tax=Streptomyces sp. NBC_00193 TaxID=2975675 RepID=UPI0022591D5C|nr:nucleotidyl transferase AbiEii/AbiGii toxin family protein [Streptomyces sp. NBC_00193]MCX5298555.1 nucleotidyl transferase AbiEii/AbiGii toxin family protein [Streptomyces sp. NBC_00193]